ncbi:MAG: tetratricopeptide repeat protein [Gaiellales bacterium]
MDVTIESFESEVVARSAAIPVVVDFWASWCGPCLALAPVLEKAVAERDGAVVLVKVDVDANQELARRFNVSGIPAVKAFKDGRVVDEFTGALSPASVSVFLDRLLAPPAADGLLEELRATGALPDVAEAIAAGDVETALRLLVDGVASASPDEREQRRAAAVALFDDLGAEHPLAVTYRRRLATALY